MPDSVLIPNAAAVGITITHRVDAGNYSDYYCLGGPNYTRQGRWVKTTTADSDATKLTALQTGLA